MAESPDLSEIMRRTVQANARFYQGWVNLSLEYLRGISEIFGVTTPSPPAPPDVETSDPGTGVLVLEGEAGTIASGAFLVTNDLGRNMVCELVSAEFADAGGERVPASPRFAPPKVELVPGEQKVVQVMIPIDAKLSPGVAYNGQFSIKGMDGFAIPVVLRRRHQVDESPIEPVVPSEEIKPKPAGRRAGKTAAKRGRTAGSQTGKAEAKRGKTAKKAARKTSPRKAGSRRKS